EEDEDGKETGQRQTPHDARRPEFGFPVSGIVLRVNADALIDTSVLFFYNLFLKGASKNLWRVWGDLIQLVRLILFYHADIGVALFLKTFL
ncbi:MAG: hypothetical protein LBQ88_16940, partial [Treponema sp.]|nr:hypothetical protein [Treponema sp.]